MRSLPSGRRSQTPGPHGSFPREAGRGAGSSGQRRRGLPPAGPCLQPTTATFSVRLFGLEPGKRWQAGCAASHPAQVPSGLGSTWHTQDFGEAAEPSRTRIPPKLGLGAPGRASCKGLLPRAGEPRSAPRPCRLSDPQAPAVLQARRWERGVPRGSAIPLPRNSRCSRREVDTKVDN